MKTAVEWFAKELYEKFEMKGDGKVFDDLIEQAKEMEKEQIMNAFNQGMNNSVEYYIPYSDILENEQYYNETFKSE